MNKLVIIIVVLLFLGTIFYLSSTSYKTAKVTEKEQELLEKEEKKPVFKDGNLRYKITRIKVTSTPQRYTFPIEANWEGWYDNPKTGEPFYVQFSLDGELIDSRDTKSINHPPVGEIWISKKPGSKDQWITLSYSYPKK